MVPDAENMAQAIQAACDALLEAKLITDDFYPTLGQALGELKANGNATKAWGYSIPHSSPLTFADIANEDLNELIVPRIYLKIAVNEAHKAGNVPPICGLNCVLEIASLESGQVLFSSHIDLAEKDGGGIFQHAPLFHMQLGGHRPGADRKMEIRLKEPRLLHPPMDLLLAIEIIVANFYPDKWEELVTTAGWNEAICISQQLCYTSYMMRLSSCMGITSSTAVRQLWASQWK